MKNKYLLVFLLLSVLGCVSSVNNKKQHLKIKPFDTTPLRMVALDTMAYNEFLYYETVKVKIKISFTSILQVIGQENDLEKNINVNRNWYRDTINRNRYIDTINYFIGHVDSFDVTKFNDKYFYRYSTHLMKGLLDKGNVKVFDKYQNIYADSIIIVWYSELYDGWDGVMGRRFCLKNKDMFYDTEDMTFVK